eukprot:scaffold661_cov100-Skeletonema_menzelii.AAC.1
MGLQQRILFVLTIPDTEVVDILSTWIYRSGQNTPAVWTVCLIVTSAICQETHNRQHPLVR